jgi:hypothetical protein
MQRAILGAMRFLLFLILWCAAGTVLAEEIYRVVAADGSVHYTDRAPDKKAKPLNLGPVSGSSAPVKKAAAFYSPELLRQAARFAVRIESPTPGQKMQRDGQPLVAAVSVMPGLVRGFRLVYHLDGRPLTAQPVEDLSLPLPELAPGPHELQVVLLNAQGHEVARSELASFDGAGRSESAHDTP